MSFPRSILARAVGTVLLTAFTLPAAAQVKVDGVIDPVEWQGAEHVTDFRVVEPLTGEPCPPTSPPVSMPA